MTSPTVFSSRAGQRVVTENTGVKRIAGADLLTQGKIPEWQYYLLDIESIVVYRNDGSDVWVNGLGQAAAGSLAVRDSIPAFEGYRFYVLEQDTAYEYKSGSWTGSVFSGNTLSPTFVEINTASQLERGRKYYVTADADLTLPPLDDTAGGNGASLFGHEIEVVVARGVTSRFLPSGAEAFTKSSGTNVTPLILATATSYLLVMGATAWEVMAVDVLDLQVQLDGKLVAANNLSDVANADTARDNLDVFSTAEASADSDGAVDNIIAGSGLTKTGSSAAGTSAFAADFATASEATNPAVTDKVLSPSHVTSAVTAATRGSEFNNITGLLPATTESKFLMTANVDRTRVDYPEFTGVFNSDPYIRHDALTTVVVPAGQIVLPNTGADPTSHYVSVNSAGTISLSLGQLDKQSTSEFFLGVIVEINGEVALGAGGDVINNGPWLASTETSMRISDTTVSGGLVQPSVTVGKVAMDALTFTRESVNWEQSDIEPHQRTLGAVDPLLWTYLDRNGNVIGTLQTDEVDGNQLDDTTNVGNNEYSIQVVYSSSEGVIGVLAGQSTFSTLVAAQAAVENYNPVIPTILTNVSEISRWIVRGSQYPGSGSLDLTDANNFVATVSNTVSGGASASAAINVTASNTNSTLTATNVQEQNDELANRTDLKPTTGGGAITFPSIMVEDATPYTLPAVPTEEGVVQKLVAFGGVIATFNTNGGTNDITSSNGKFADDNVFRILEADNGKIYYLISRAGKWVL